MDESNRFYGPLIDVFFEIREANRVLSFGAEILGGEHAFGELKLNSLRVDALDPDRRCAARQEESRTQGRDARMAAHHGILADADGRFAVSAPAGRGAIGLWF